MNFRLLASTAAAPATTTTSTTTTTAHDPIATTTSHDSAATSADHCVTPVEPTLNEFLPEFLESHNFVNATSYYYTSIAADCTNNYGIRGVSGVAL